MRECDGVFEGVQSFFASQQFIEACLQLVAPVEKFSLQDRYCLSKIIRVCGSVEECVQLIVLIVTEWIELVRMALGATSQNGWKRRSLAKWQVSILRTKASWFGLQMPRP